MQLNVDYFHKYDTIPIECCNLFLSEEELANAISHQAKQDKSQFLSNGRLSDLLSPRPRHLLSFNFNQKKETGVKTITVGEKTIVEAVV